MSFFNFDEVYTAEPHYFGPFPNKYVARLKEWVPSGRVLELGCGQGSNTLALAEMGFDVLGIDDSSVGVDQLLKEAAEKGLKLRAVVDDVVKFPYEGEFDAVVSIDTFHFLEPRNSDKLIEKLKEMTKKGGVHVVRVHTEDNPQKAFPNLFKKQSLLMKYAGWQIIHYKESISSEHQHGKIGKKHFHNDATLVAKKL